jgi:Protein of unknown function (DUF3179)
MYDSATHSLWNQFTGRPVVGPLTGSGIELKTRPVVIASWGRLEGAPSEHQGAGLGDCHRRDYSTGADLSRRLRGNGLCARDAKRGNKAVLSFVLMAPPVPLEAVEGALEAQRKVLAEELVRLKTILEAR